MDIKAAIQAISAGRNLETDEMQEVMHQIMSGNATPAQIGGFLVSLHIKGETVDELVGAARVMREFASNVVVHTDKVVDSVGTGGDSAGLFNVSTASALVTAAAGAVVAKHGNRAATGKSGSADVLEAAGVNITLTPEQVGETIEAVGIGFMFAPTHHGATRHAVGPRREIGVRSIFNLLGPLTNPANARWQLVGVFDERWNRPMAEVFKALGSVHTLVVCSKDGLDEISIASDTAIAELKDGEVTGYSVSPEQFGIEVGSLEALRVESAAQSLAMLKSALSGETGAPYDMVALNAGATIYAGDLAESLEAGVEQAREILDSGAALRKLEELAAFSSRFNADN